MSEGGHFRIAAAVLGRGLLPICDNGRWMDFNPRKDHCLDTMDLPNNDGIQEAANCQQVEAIMFLIELGVDSNLTCSSG